MRLLMKSLAGLLILIVVGTAGCARLATTLYAPMQPDGWSAQPVSIASRFAADAKLDSATQTPVGDVGYYLYVLTKAGDWDYSNARSFVISLAQQPWGHSWLILESPAERLECGLNGNFGLDKPTYGEGVSQRLRNGDPNPISYLWVTMSDGQMEVGNGSRNPTFVWRMPINRQQYQLIQKHVTQWKYDKIGVRANNCVDIVTEAAELAGINLIHRVRLTIPPEIKMQGKTLHVWTDPKYRILEYSTPDVLEVDLRHLARFGVGCDVTEKYLVSNMVAPKSKDSALAGSRNSKKPGREYAGQ